jgi:regulation of enolase protein 1 (concanavalin A-like superfamily)
MQIDAVKKIYETKKFSEEVKYFNQQWLALPTNCKDSENNVISQTEQVLKRWTEWFYNIRNPKRH